MTSIPAWFIWATVLPSCLAALIATYIIRRVADRIGLVDRPNESRKVHSQATPLGGGLAIWFAVMLPFAIGQFVLWLVHSGRISGDFIPAFAQSHLNGIWERSGSLWLLLTAATVLMVVGLMDDRFGVGWKIRLALQFLVAMICVTWQDWRLTAFIGAEWITWTLSVLWIVALINSFNMLDNMDGLSGGVAVISAGMLAIVLLIVPAPDNQGPQLFVGGFLLVLVGAILGFLWHNRAPAKIFMGDAGSYFIGFCIAVATLEATYTSYDSTSQHAILAPLCVLAVPLYDMATVIWIRIRAGRSPFQADKSHFSHRLVDLGLTKGQAVLTIYLTTATCGLGALLMHQVNWVGAVVVVLMIVCVLGLIAILESAPRRD